MAKGRVNLFIKNNIFIADASESLEILKGRHRIYFEIALGLKIKTGETNYILEDENSFFDIIPEVIDYLKNNKIESVLDEEVTNLINNYHSEQNLFNEAKNLGIKIKKNPVKQISIPKLKRVLKPYQVNPVIHMCSLKHSANFSVPGSGKTTIVYSVFDILKEKKEINKLFVIGPRSCFQPWEDEYKLCFGRNPASIRLTGTKRERLAIYFRWKEFKIFLCTYQTACNDLDKIISTLKKDNFFLVLDEAHYIKRFEGGTWAEAMLKIAKYAKKRAILTGTPMPNSLKDLWTQLNFLWPMSEILGDKGSYYYLCENEDNLQIVQKKIEPFFTRIPKSDLGLPPQKFKRVLVKPNKLQQKIYNVLAAKFLKEIDVLFEERKELREWRKARIVRLIQAASNPATLAKHSEEFNIPAFKPAESSLLKIIKLYPKYEVPAKIKYAITLSNKLLKSGQKVIIWSSLVHNIKMLSNLIKEIKPFIIYGAIPKDERENVEFNREQQIREFKEKKTPSILLANPAACAESISLHKVCHHAIYLDRTFNCGQYMQSLDRIHRVGLKRNENVYYHILICSNTIDETIDRRLLEKQDSMNHILEDKSAPLGSFDVEPMQLGKDEDEEMQDLLAVIEDLKRHVASEK